MTENKNHNRLSLNNELSKIRTSPTVSRLSYDIFSIYGIPISNFIERSSMRLVYNDDELADAVYCEIKVKEEILKKYKEDKRVFNIRIDKKISKLENEIKQLEEDLVDNINEKVAENLAKAQEMLLIEVKNERSRNERYEKENRRYIPKKISEETVLNICNDNNVTPKMVLPLINSNVLKTFFDEKCNKYLK